MKNKGFTLIELLAVIVILAIIALIATPIVINMIGSAKDSSDERSAELYLDAVEQAVARKNLTEKFSPSTCTIQSDGNLKCDGDTLLEVQVENTRPTSGTITFEKGKILDYTFEIGGKKYANNSSTSEPEPIAESCFTTKDVTGGVSITGYNCGTGSENEVLDVVIPNTIAGKNVVAIGERAFLGAGLTSVEIPKGITEIEAGVFAQNKLKSVTIPEGVTYIGSMAFYQNQLTTLVLPDSVEHIDSLVFSGNQLTSVKLSEKLSYIGNFAFQNNKLTKLEIPKSVTKLDGGTFCDNPLTEVTIYGKFFLQQLTSATDPMSEFVCRSEYASPTINFVND